MIRILCLAISLVAYFLGENLDYAFWSAFTLAVIAELECHFRYDAPGSWD